LINGAVCSAEKAAAGQCTDNFGFNDGSDDFWAVNVNNDSPHLSIGKGWTAEITYSPSEKEDIIWINAFSRLDRQHAFNCDGSPADLCEGNLGLKAELLTNELRYHHDADKGYLTAGLFQLQERIYQDNYNDILRDLRVIPVFWGNTKNYFYDNEIISKVYAVFAQYEWRWLESTSLTFGLRYSDEAVDYDSVSTTNVVEDINNLDGVIRPFYDGAGRVEDDGLSGKISINHKLSNNNLLYYSFANGKKSGGYNGGLLSSPEQARDAHYGAESLRAHEFGAKLFYPEQSLSVNSAVFYYDYRDQQVFMNQPSSIAGAVPVQLLKNVADSTIYGLETDIKFDLNTQVSTQLGVGYIPHAQFKEYVDPTGFSLTDKQLPFTSEWNINGEIAYEISMGSANITTRLGFDYQSDYYFDQQQTDYAKQDSFVLWHLNAQYDSDTWMVSVWAKNLFDEEYSNLKFDLRNFLGMLEDFKGEGRRLGLDVSYRF
jgi:iron complex outermembrane receptor protein